MNWVGLIAALVVTVLVQTTVCRLGDLPLIDLDLMLVLALLYGLVAPVPDARIAAWIIGFTCDLTTEGALGVHALAFGLTGLFVTQLREVLNRRLWWGRLLICFAAAVPGQLLVPLHLRFFQGAGTHAGSMWQICWSAVLISVVAALVAAVVTLLPPLAPHRRMARGISWGRR